MNLIKLAIFAVAMLIGAGLCAQETVTATGFTKQLIYQRGGYGADSVFGLPVRDTTAMFAAFRNKGRITLNPNDSLIYFHNGARWVAVGEGGGSIDTSLFLKWTDTVSVLATKSDLNDITQFRPKQDRWLSQIAGIPTDGVTSVAAYVQPVLDSADILGGLRLHWDIPRTTIDSELRVKSNTIIEGVDNPYVKLLDNVRQPFFINYNIAPGAPMVDSNISIRNFYLDGNCFGNIDTAKGYITRDNSLIVGIMLAGVKRVRLENIVFYQTNAWGVAFFNVDYSYVSNLTGIRDYNFVSPIDIPGSNWRLGKVPLSMDLINYRGGCEYGYWEDLKSNSPDDAVAINNIEYSASLGGGAYASYDPVHDIYGNGLFLDSSSLGIAIYSSQAEVYNIGVSNIYGSVQHRWGYAGSNANAAGAIVGYTKGNTRNISIGGVNVQLIAPRPNTFDYTVITNSMFYSDGNIGTLNLTNISLNKWQRYLRSFHQEDGFNINELTVNNYTETHDKDTTLNLPRFVLNGVVKRGLISNVKFSRLATIAQDGKFITIDSGNTIALSNFQGFNIDTVVSTAGLGIKRIILNGVDCDSCLSTGGIIHISNGSPTVKVTQTNVNAVGTKYAFGTGGAAVANILTENFGDVAYKSRDNVTTNQSWAFSNFNGHFIAPASAAETERWHGFTNTGGTSVVGALSGKFSSSGVLQGMTLSANTGSYASGNATFIMDIPGATANVMRFWPNNTVGIKRVAQTAFDLDVNGRGNYAGALFTGDSLFVIKNFNGSLMTRVVNANSGNLAQGVLSFYNDLNSEFTLFKYSSTRTAYKFLTSNANGIYASSGIMGFLNDGGNLLFGSNGSTTAQLTLDATGLSLGASTKLKLYNNSAPTDGQLLIGHTANGTFEKATLTAGTGINITNGAGAITIARSNDGTGTVSSAGTLTLNRDDNYVFSGTTATWTLPAVSGTAWRRFFIKNRGSGNVTINAAAAANEIYTTLATNTYTLTPGSAIILVSDGTFWNVE